uniref:Uncharacterized protein n=1 Tax=Neolamprologus brichardi TaxID=32507 RepID=A0A3Q4NAA8_NEOBR
KKKKKPLHPCPLHSQVRQWIADRVTGNSSPGSPSTFSYPGSSTTPDWSTPRRERSSPLRGPHGKFVSPSSLGAYSSSSSPPDQGSSQRSRSERHTDMAELAKHEADIEHRTQALKREGFWSMKRLTRLTEPPRRCSGSRLTLLKRGGGREAWPER